MPRCAIPGLDNDTYEIVDEHHLNLVKKYIPLSTSSIKEDYDNCNLKSVNSSSNQNLTKCSRWVFSKQYFEKTIVTEVSTETICKVNLKVCKIKQQNLN